MIFHQSKNTLDTISTYIHNKQMGAYLRFGDGDVNLANGLSGWDCNENDMTHPETIQLSKEMIESFKLEGPGVLKTLPLYCNKYGGLEEGMYPGNHEASVDWCNNILDMIKAWWIPNEVYSHCALHFMASHKPEIAQNFLRGIRGHIDLFIGGANIPDKIVHYVFGRDCEIISVPSRGCSYIIDEIEASLPPNANHRNIAVCMGCTGRVLQKRLYVKGYNAFSFDIGSFLDALSGIKSRAWIELTGFDADKFMGGL